MSKRLMKFANLATPLPLPLTGTLIGVSFGNYKFPQSPELHLAFVQRLHSHVLVSICKIRG